MTTIDPTTPSVTDELAPLNGTLADTRHVPSPSLARPHLIGLAALALVVTGLGITAFAVNHKDQTSPSVPATTNATYVWSRLEPSTRQFLCESDEPTRMAIARNAAVKSGQTEGDALALVALMALECR